MAQTLVAFSSQRFQLEQNVEVGLHEQLLVLVLFHQRLPGHRVVYCSEIDVVDLLQGFTGQRRTEVCVPIHVRKMTVLINQTQERISEANPFLHLATERRKSNVWQLHLGEDRLLNDHLVIRSNFRWSRWAWEFLPQPRLQIDVLLLKICHHLVRILQHLLTLRLVLSSFIIFTFSQQLFDGVAVVEEFVVDVVQQLNPHANLLLIRFSSVILQEVVRNSQVVQPPALTLRQ
uniref:(northern house mosquito) hypothetical protein n=1 Tax=Culex pipiens TaxID=7175 RepID=A0A8D8FN88_CULPI